MKTFIFPLLIACTENLKKSGFDCFSTVKLFDYYFNDILSSYISVFHVEQND